MGNIVSRTLNEVGKEFWPHEDHGDDEHEARPVTDKAIQWVRIGDRQHHCGTLLKEGIEFWHHKDRYRRAVRVKYLVSSRTRKLSKRNDSGNEVTEDEDGEVVEARVEDAMEHTEDMKVDDIEDVKNDAEDMEVDNTEGELNTLKPWTPRTLRRSRGGY